jgi:hypothetical protein
MIKNILFSIFGYAGVIAIILVLMWVILEFANRFFKIVKYIIMYRQYAKEKELYENRDNVIINKNGEVLYSCATSSIEQTISTLKKAIDSQERLKQLRDKYTD